MNDKINLIIEGKSLTCAKDLLAENSEFFKRILGTHSFVECGSNELKLQDVEYKTMETIIQLLRQPHFTLGKEELLMTLLAADMLQFAEIRNICIGNAIELIDESTCIDIWFMTEHIIDSLLSAKAKRYAMQEFASVKSSGSLNNINVSQLCAYLSHTSLVCETEFSVFEAFMSWWYENNDNANKVLPCREDNLLCMLYCMDFNNISISDISEMLLYDDVKSSNQITDILICIKSVKQDQSLENPSKHFHICQKLLKSRKRCSYAMPLFLMNIVVQEKMVDAIVTDKYKRKRMQTIVGKTGPHNRDTDSSLKALFLYDEKISKYSKFLEIPLAKTRGLSGFNIQNYKELIFLFGGEYGIGTGMWNLNLWAFDTIKERWQIKSKLPNGRRHFLSCLLDSKIFMIGGYGNFRKVQNDLICYDYKTDVWSNSVHLPCPYYDIKSCNFKNKLLLLQLTIKKAYLFDAKKFTFTTLEIEPPELVKNKYSIFSRNEKLYIKGSSLFEFELMTGKFVLRRTIQYNRSNVPNYMDEVVVKCEDVLYTYYCIYFDEHIILEKLDLTNFKVSYPIMCDNIISCEEGDVKHHPQSHLICYVPVQSVNIDSFVNDITHLLRK